MKPQMLTKTEAMAVMATGHKVSHIYFSEDEWMRLKGKQYEFENGCVCSIKQFWEHRQDEAFQNNWFIVG